MKKNTPLWTLADIKDEIKRVGVAGTVFVEGDLCRRAWRPHAETFMRGDDMDYNPDAVVPLKKTILRVEMLCPFPCSTTLWRQRPDLPETCEPLLYGSFSSPDGIAKPPNRGYAPPAIPPHLKTVFLQGKTSWKATTDATGKQNFQLRPSRVTASDVKKPKLLQHYVPVMDSLGDVAAALEIFIAVLPASR